MTPETCRFVAQVIPQVIYFWSKLSITGKKSWEIYARAYTTISFHRRIELGSCWYVPYRRTPSAKLNTSKARSFRGACAPCARPSHPLFFVGHPLLRLSTWAQVSADGKIRECLHRFVSNISTFVDLWYSYSSESWEICITCGEILFRLNRCFALRVKIRLGIRDRLKCDRRRCLVKCNVTMIMKIITLSCGSAWSGFHLSSTL